jgi:hypothetical protein
VENWGEAFKTRILKCMCRVNWIAITIGFEQQTELRKFWVCEMRRRNVRICPTLHNIVSFILCHSQPTRSNIFS